MTSKVAAFVAGFLIIGAMTANAQVFQAGKFLVDRTVPTYSLDQGNGDRSVTVEITFETPFNERPIVALSVTNLDISKDTNSRYDVKTISVSRDGFVIQVRTWSDTKIHSLGGSWIAYASK